MNLNRTAKMSWTSDASASSVSKNDSASIYLEEQDFNLWFLLLCPIPLATIVGNIFVVIVMLTGKALQTPTNYLLVNLAVADLLVGVIVQPFSIYILINHMHWRLSAIWCHLYNVTDVTASTASILNLVAVSIERFYAISKRLEYSTTPHDCRITITIVFVWIFSLTTGLCLPLGSTISYESPVSPISSSPRSILQNAWPMRRIKNPCQINDFAYTFYASVFAFFIPCLVMVVMYGVVFWQLRRRIRSARLKEMFAGRIVNFSSNLNSVIHTAHGGPGKHDAVRRDTFSWAVPFIKDLQQNIMTIEDEDEVSSEDVVELNSIIHSLEASSRRSNRSKRNAPLISPPSSTPPLTANGSVDTAETADLGTGSDPSDASSFCSQAEAGADNNNGSGEVFCNAAGSQHLVVPSTSTRASTKRKLLHANTAPAVRFRIFEPILERRRSSTGAAAASKVQRRSRDDSAETSKGKRINFKEDAAGKCGEKRKRLRWRQKTETSVDEAERTSLFKRGSERRSSLISATQRMRALKERALKLLMKLKNREGRQVRKESRATKLVATVLAVFLVCWMPFFVLNIIWAFQLREGRWDYEFGLLFYIFSWLGYLNSCLNPLVYSLLNHRFRQRLNEILFCTTSLQNNNPSNQLRNSLNTHLVSTKRLMLPSDEKPMDQYAAEKSSLLIP